MRDGAPRPSCRLGHAPYVPTHVCDVELSSTSRTQSSAVGSVSTGLICCWSVQDKVVSPGYYRPPLHVSVGGSCCCTFGLRVCKRWRGCGLCGKRRSISCPRHRSLAHMPLYHACCEVYLHSHLWHDCPAFPPAAFMRVRRAPQGGATRMTGTSMPPVRIGFRCTRPPTAIASSRQCTRRWSLQQRIAA